MFPGKRPRIPDVFSRSSGPEQNTNFNTENQPKERIQNASGTYWICTRASPITTPTTSNLYSSPEHLFEASQTRAERANSRCFFQPTVSAGVPKSVERRVLTSTNATSRLPVRSPSRVTTRSMSRWPLRKRRSITAHPRVLSHRAAIVSPRTPSCCRSVSTETL